MKTRTIIICLLILGALSGQSLFAQNNDSRQVEQLRVFLETNDELLDRAKDALKSASNPISDKLIQQAGELQEKAWNSFRNGQYQQAFEFGKLARQLGKDALETAQKAQRSDAAVIRALERAGNIMERIKEFLSSRDNNQLQAVFRTTQENLERAWEFYRNGQYRPAAKLANQVEKAAHNLIERLSHLQKIHQEFEQRSQKTEELLVRAQLMVAECNNSSADQLVEQAVKAFERAKQFAGNGNMEPAVQTLGQAHSMAMRAIRACRDNDILESQYSRLKVEVEDVKELLSGSSNETAIKLFEQVEEQLSLARKYIDQENPEAATAALQATKLALRQVKRYLDGR